MVEGAALTACAVQTGAGQATRPQLTTMRFNPRCRPTVPGQRIDTRRESHGVGRSSIRPRTVPPALCHGPQPASAAQPVHAGGGGQGASRGDGHLELPVRRAGGLASRLPPLLDAATVAAIRRVSCCRRGRSVLTNHRDHAMFREATARSPCRRATGICGSWARKRMCAVRLDGAVTGPSPCTVRGAPGGSRCGSARKFRH